MILNVNRYANVVLESSLRANEGRIGVNEYINHNETNLDTNEWIFSGNEQQKLYYKTTDENIRDSKTARLMPREIYWPVLFIFHRKKPILKMKRNIPFRSQNMSNNFVIQCFPQYSANIYALLNSLNC